MAEEVKQDVQPQEEKREEGKKSASEVSKTILKVILGIILIVVGILAVIKWWGYLVTVFLGCIGLFLILAGAITIAIARD